MSIFTLPTTHTRVIPPTVWSRARFHNGTLITVFGKSKFGTPFALRCCVIWAFNARQRKEADGAAALN
jgi:hypothetical protein